MDELDLREENELLRGEIRVARRAADITADLVVKQFEETSAALERLQEVNTQREAVLAGASQMSIIASDLDGTIILFNKGAETLLGYEAAEVIGRRSVLDLHLEEELFARGEVLSSEVGRRVHGVDVFAMLAAEGHSQAQEWTYVRKDGGHMPVSLSITALRSAENEVTGYLGAAMDLTSHKLAEQAVRRANALMEDAIRYSPIFLWEMDTDERLTFLRGAHKIMGYSAEELLGRRLSDLRCHEIGCQEQRGVVDEAFAQRRTFDRLLSCILARDGLHMWITMSGHPIFDAEGTFRGYRGVSVDVTELQRARHALEKMALHDQLTGLANRRLLYDRFVLETARAKRNSGPLSILVVDIDYFKRVNDRYGHLVGDACLQALAAVFENKLREADLVARFGGEEFIVLLPETDAAEAELVAQKLRRGVETSELRVAGLLRPLHVTVCVGVATMLPDLPLSFDDLMELADRACYRAKQAGRNRVIVADGDGAAISDA